uniref:Triosephosphate isomerase n=1 Tax=Pinguiococcus pyrenoidosus TaxID=172671 RepID=A0A7R9YB15_9STRA|mmetsp:Transcript_17607/g.66981  ORF Transcript_17607/g.66981 Transcript_17607/m.66981 type:complete len:301 (+) Transcript_17607:91-993(+)
MMRYAALLALCLAPAHGFLQGLPARSRPAFALHAQRQPFIAGNWKLNPVSVTEAESLLSLLAANQRALETAAKGSIPEVCVFPPLPFIPTAIQHLAGTSIKVGAQDISLETAGAFTGEVSAPMVRSLGCDYVLVGHSERRTLFGETDETIAEKIGLALEAGLKVVLCVGETEQEYDNDLLRPVVILQVKKALKAVSQENMANIVIAYEPVWAIGTGKVATPEQAQTAHDVIRATLQGMFNDEIAQSTRIQYGGSVSPESVDNLMAQPDIDGALVGGASLVAEKFSRIIEFDSSNLLQGAR